MHQEKSPSNDRNNDGIDAYDIITKNKIRKESYLNSCLSEVGAPINDSTRESMRKLIKREKRTIFMVIESIIGLIILFLIVYLQIQGLYNRTELVLDCKNPEHVIMHNGQNVDKNITDYNVPREQLLPFWDYVPIEKMNFT